MPSSPSLEWNIVCDQQCASVCGRSNLSVCALNASVCDSVCADGLTDVFTVGVITHWYF